MVVGCLFILDCSFDFLFTFEDFLAKPLFISLYSRANALFSKDGESVSILFLRKFLPGGPPLSLRIRRNGQSRIRSVKNVRQLGLFEIAWDGELIIVNRVVAYRSNRARDFRPVIGRARAGLVGGHLLTKDHACADR
jgi:hypothetical protein